MEINTKMIKAVYLASSDIYQGKISEQTALDKLESEEWNRNSATTYINNFQKMMKGEEYGHTMNGKATDYFISHIRSEYGDIKFHNAIEATKKHIKSNKNPLNNIKKIVVKYENE